MSDAIRLGIFIADLKLGIEKPLAHFMGVVSIEAGKLRQKMF